MRNRNLQGKVGMTDKGVEFIRHLDGRKAPTTKFELYNKRRHENGNDKHDMFRADILIPIMKEARETDGFRFISEREIFDRAPGNLGKKYCGVYRRNTTDDPRAMAKSVFYNNRSYRNLQVIPDDLFGLEITKNGKTYESFFMLEADRGTEPITAQSLFRSSIIRKLILYEEVCGWPKKRKVQKKLKGISDGKKLTIVEETFGIKARPLIITKGKDADYKGDTRLKNIIRTHQEVSETDGGDNRLRVGNMHFVYSKSPLNHPLKNGKGEEVNLAIHPIKNLLSHLLSIKKSGSNLIPKWPR